MLRSYLKIALRTLRRHAGYTAINVVGLAVGLAVCVLVGLYVRHELRYDRFHAQADRIHRMVRAEHVGDAFGLSSARAFEGTASMPPGLAQALQDRMPGIAQSTTVDVRGNRLLGWGDERIYVDRILQADTAFFDVFSFEMQRGDPATALDAPGRIVLTASLADRLFGTDDPMGRTVVYENETEYEVTGVVADPPSTSHLQFEAIRSLSKGERKMRYGSTVRWPFYGNTIYLVLQETTDPRQLEATIRDYERDTDKPEWMTNEVQLRLQPLTHVHLYSTGLSGNLASHGDVRYLYFFGLIGVLILGIACINYMNLATARATRRAREVGVRKTVGAGRLQLIRQFVGESVLIALLALPVALAAAQLVLPLVNDIAGTSLRLRDVPLLGGLGTALGLVVLVGVGAGSYPAFVLSRFRPADILAQAGRSTTRGGSAWLRKGLVVVQFGAAVALILATFVVSDQLDYVQTKALGFDEERVLTFDKDPLGDQFATFKEELQQHAAVASVSAGPPVGVGHKNMTRTVSADTERRVSIMTVDSNYLETLEVRLVAGRSFSPSRSTDIEQSVILTESAVAAFGLKGNPVGQSLPWDDGQWTVIGVAEDFHNESLHEPIQPVVLQFNPESTWSALVRLAPGTTREGLDAVRATWNAFLPDRPFTFEFLDQRIEAQYRAEQRLATLFGLFAGLAIFVAALGVLGLAAFMAQQRTKEIGIRKALGATVTHIVGLLSREFVVLVAVAFSVAAPLAYWGMQQWLQNFAFRTDIGPGLVLGVGALVLSATLAAAGYHALRAAHTDPAVALRDE